MYDSDLVQFLVDNNPTTNFGDDKLGGGSIALAWLEKNNPAAFGQLVENYRQAKGSGPNQLLQDQAYGARPNRGVEAAPDETPQAPSYGPVGAKHSDQAIAATQLGAGIATGGMFPALTGAAGLATRVGAPTGLAALLGKEPMDIAQTAVGSALPDIAQGVGYGYNRLRGAKLFAAEDARNVADALNAGTRLPPDYAVRTTGTPDEIAADISAKMTPKRGGTRDIINDRYGEQLEGFSRTLGDPTIRVPSLDNTRDIPLSRAISAWQEARRQVQQGAAAGGIDAAVGNKNAVADAGTILDDIQQGLRASGAALRDPVRVQAADALDVIRRREGNALTTTEIATGRGPGGSQTAVPLDPQTGRLNMEQLQISLRAAVQDGRMTADDAANLFQQAIRRGAPGVDSADVRGKLSLPIWLRGGNHVGASGNLQAMTGIQIPRPIGDPRYLADRQWPQRMPPWYATPLLPGLVNLGGSGNE